MTTFLDLGGCDNVVNSQFARTQLQLPIIPDDSQGANQLQQTVNGQVFSFSEYTEVFCNFNNYKEKVKFFLVDNLAHPFLFGYPFFRKQGAQFDLRNQCMVTLSSIPQSPTIRLSKLSTSGSEQDTISLFTGHNSLFCTF